MNVAVVGKSAVNKLLHDLLQAEGYASIAVENVNDVLSLQGQVGAFDLRTANGTFEAGCVVFTENSQTGETYPFPSVSLLKADVMQICKNQKNPIVFLLDYPTETPAFMTRIAIEKAIKMARKKRNVIYLTRFVRTAEKGLETLYGQARMAGVVFVKYNEFSAEYDSETDLFTLQISNGYEDMTLTTNALISADKIMASATIDNAAKVLKLKNVHNGVVVNEHNALLAGYTNRKGIHALSFAEDEFRGEDLALRIKSIVLNVKHDLTHLPNNLHAEIDPEKCALCYTCYRACPHAAMVQDNENSVMKNLPDNCYACGICVAVCPADAVTLIKEDKQEVGSAKTGKLKVFCCENSGEIALQKLYDQHSEEFTDIDVTAIACGGEVSTEMLLGALQGYAKVLVAVCIDEACKHFEGNKRTVRQVERATAMLAAAGLDKASIEVVKLSNAMPLVAYDYIRSMA